MEHSRRTPRYPFGAPAELIVEHSDAKMLVRVKELSLYGCYLDTSIPLSTETSVQIKIFGLHDYFEASATVIYAHPNLGMGLAFRDVKPGILPVLQKWLLQAVQKQEPQDG
jgi:PilZ domain